MLDFSVLCVFKERSSPVVPAFCAFVISPVSCGLEIWCVALSAKTEGSVVCFQMASPWIRLFLISFVESHCCHCFDFLCLLSVLWTGDQKVCSALMYLSLLELKSFKPRIILLKMLVLEGEQILPHC